MRPEPSLTVGLVPRRLALLPPYQATVLIRAVSQAKTLDESNPTHALPGSIPEHKTSDQEYFATKDDL